MSQPNTNRKYSSLYRNSGFTLIELLVVISVVLILSGITFGISRGVQNSQARAQAKAELAVIAQGLEQFKSFKYNIPGDISSASFFIVLTLLSKDSKIIIQNVNVAEAVKFFKSLWGWMKLERIESVTPGSGSTVELVELASAGTRFIDATKMNLNRALPDDNSVPTNLFLVDPWGNNYLYTYNKASNAWDNFGYALYSQGPDGDCTRVDTDGIVTESLRTNNLNIDNIYSGI